MILKTKLKDIKFDPISILDETNRKKTLLLLSNVDEFNGKQIAIVDPTDCFEIELTPTLKFADTVKIAAIKRKEIANMAGYFRVKLLLTSDSIVVPNCDLHTLEPIDYLPQQRSEEDCIYIFQLAVELNALSPKHLEFAFKKGLKLNTLNSIKEVREQASKEFSLSFLDKLNAAWRLIRRNSLTPKLEDFILIESTSIKDFYKTNYYEPMTWEGAKNTPGPLFETIEQKNQFVETKLVETKEVVNE